MSEHAFPLDLGTSSKLPALLKPQLATPVESIPEDEHWVHEIKYDGYRLIARIEDGKARLITRGGHDWTARFPTLTRALLELPVASAILDGEVVVLNADGTSNFQQLQNILKAQGEGELVFYAFDLPFCQGRDLRDLPLTGRKAILQEVLQHAGEPLRFSSHIVGNGPGVLEQACKLGCEGVISKRAQSPYTERRTRDWLKSKCLREEQFVVVGFSEGRGSRIGFGSLLLAQRESEGLRFAGRVGTGFDARMLEQMRAQLDPLIVTSSPLESALSRAQSKGVTWVKPELLAQVGYAERTESGTLRHPRFHGERLRSQTVGGPIFRKIKFTSPERVVDPDSGLTKLDLALYYESVGPRLMPHIEQRPLTVVRCPDGTSGQCFYQKQVKQGFPKSIRSVTIEQGDSVEEYILLDSLEGLLDLVQLGGMEFHPWASRADDLERPDRLVFDLDPDVGLAWERVVQAALALRLELLQLGLESFCKTTGGKGLHVVVPLVPKLDWNTAKAFSKAFAYEMARKSPREYTAVMSKERRKGKIFLDYLRNGRGATSVATYSARSRPGLPVSLPLEWSEVIAEFDPQSFTVANWPERAALDAGVWVGFEKTRQSITSTMLRQLAVSGTAIP